MPRLEKITTRRGDDGSTDLPDGKRIRKDSPRIQALGSLDELNSAIGRAKADRPRPDVAACLLEIQNDLFCLGAMLARPSAERGKHPSPAIAPDRIRALDQAIARRREQLGSLENFLLPGGTASAASLHVARAVCRRAERDVAALARTARVAPEISVYLNRLSDLLFQLARAENASAGTAETFWSSR